MIVTQQISALDTHMVRYPVLRPGKPIDSCVFDGDEDKGTFHLGLFSDRHLIGVCSFLLKKTPHSNNNIQYQLRGMAVLHAHQKKGYGKKLLEKGLYIIRQRKGELVWCNAREIARDFYHRNGFELTGTPFFIPEIGKHYIMLKKL